MGCNCKTTEKIAKIHSDYGVKTNKSWGERAGFKIGEFIKVMIVTIICIIAFPIIFIGVIVRGLIGKTNININKVLNKLLRKDKK